MRIRMLGLLAAVALLGYAACVTGEQADTEKTGAGIRQLQAQDKLLRAQVSTLKKKVSGLKKKVSGLEGRVKRLREENDSLKAEIAKLRLILAKTQTRPASQPGSHGTYFLIPVKGQIGEDFTAAHMKTYLNQAAQARPAVVVLEIDTPGGSVSETEKIVDLLVSFKGLRFVALVRKGISAGAAITLACKEIYVSDTAIIGATTSWYRGDDNLPNPLAEKFQSLWRATCRKAAQCGGHSSLIAEAMADPDFALTARNQEGRPVLERDGKGKVLKAKGKILSLTAAEAIECGLAKGRAGGSAALGGQLGMQGWRQLKGRATLGGRPLDEASFEKLYARYRYSFVVLDGKYVRLPILDLQEKGDLTSLAPSKAGHISLAWIVQVLGPEEMLVRVFTPAKSKKTTTPSRALRRAGVAAGQGALELRNRWRRANQFKKGLSTSHYPLVRFKGWPTKGLTDDALWRPEGGEQIAVIGTWRYRTSDGGSRTVLNAIRLEQARKGITKQQFRDLLQSGVNLTP